ncbi:MAG: putative pre-16S rRNA nuclease [Phycisphaerae bacterium]|jgi:putative Holliday junction resolvase|nr:MAG: putative pre-16S rRNA nuclease [Phycisphaerae bacterium]
MRTLAIDPGSKRIGLAISDAGGQWATPLEVIVVNDPVLAIPSIIQVVRREGVERIVIGFPLNMDDTLGPQAQKVIAWSKQLIESMRSLVPSHRVIFVDERLSSFEADQRLIDLKRSGAKLTRQQKKNRIDAVSAAGFLQAFLDGKLPPLPIALQV